MKKITFTKDDLQSLQLLVGGLVLSNYKFQSYRVGAALVTVQTILNDWTPETIEEYGLQVHAAVQKLEANPFGDEDSMTGRRAKQLRDVLDFLKLARKYRLFKSQEAKLRRELADNASKLDSLKTPDEVRAELVERQKQLKSLLGDESEISDEVPATAEAATQAA